ncbi:MAG: 1-acyl-sn-glycerol-3-phosphate acyltransferase [Leptospiraceae bacterium]|nr:1-acyl-sn-glycerol-3-phosphate acyltransferase [Leptospiraceae bacterium]
MSIESFIPANISYPLLWFLDLNLGTMLKLVHNIDEVIVSETDKKMLRTLNKERVIYISNHPSTKEPPIAFLVGNLMGSRFKYMASREVFDWGNGMVGKAIRSIGAYSIIAGSADRESLKATREILASERGKLVLFPEGEPTGAENDNLLPFQSGVTQLGFWGFEDALKKDPNAEIQILTTFVKYRMSAIFTDNQRDVDRSLERMEKFYGLSKNGLTLLERIFAIGGRLMESKEKEFGIPVEHNEDFDYRIGRLRHYILDMVAEKAKLKRYKKEDNAIDKLRYVLSQFELVSVGTADPKGELPSKEITKWGRDICQKVYDFITIKGDYLAKLPSAERIYEWIYRFEAEIFGSTSPRSTKAYISFAEPIKLSTYFKEYKSSKNKKEIVDNLTLKLRNTMQEMLDADITRSQILFPNDYRF